MKNYQLEVNLKVLKELVCKKVSIESSKKINAIIESLHDRQDYARYHYQTYRSIIEKVDNDLLKFKLALQIEDADKKDMIAIKANITSCIQSIHITHDILAYLISTILSLNLNESKITFNNVLKKVNDYKNLKNLLDEFSSHNDYKYLVSYVNHTKHRFHIEPKITYYFTVNKDYIAEFEEFDFKGNKYEKQNIEEFLLREFNREQKLIIEIENELINILSN